MAKLSHGYNLFQKTIDTTLMGNNTYRMIRGFDVPFPYPDKTNYVFSRSKKNKDTEFVTFITGDIPNFIKQLKREKGQDIWLIGGGQIDVVPNLVEI